MFALRTLFYTLIVFLVSLTAVTIYAAWPSINASLHTLKVMPADEPLTELYFNDIESLPQSATRSLEFSFTIHNLEGKDMIYPYAVLAEFPDGRVTVLDRNTIPIAQGDAVRIPETLRLKASGKVRIIVELPDTQRISFLLK